MDAVFKIPAIPNKKQPSPEKASSKKTSKKSLKRKRSVEREKLSPSLEKVSKKKKKNDDAIFSEVRDEKANIQTGDIFPSDVTSKLENWQHLADTNHVGKICYRRIVDEAIPFIPVLNSKSKKIYYTRIDLKPQLKKNLKYSLKPSEKEDDWDSESLEKVERRLKRPVCFSGKKADVRLSYRWRNIFFVKRFFTTGIRKTNNAEVHMLQIGENPLYLFEKCAKSDDEEPRTFDSKILSKEYKKYCLSPNKIYIVPEETSYCLVSYCKTTFGIDRCSRKFVERLIRKKELKISRWIPDPYELAPPTPFLDRFTDWKNDDEGPKIEEDEIDSTEKGNSHAFENCLVRAFVPDSEDFSLMYLLPETSPCPEMETTQENNLIQNFDYPIYPTYSTIQEQEMSEFREDTIYRPQEQEMSEPARDTIYRPQEQEMSDDEEFEQYERCIDEFLESLRSSQVFQEQSMPDIDIKEEEEPPKCSQKTQFDSDWECLDRLLNISDEILLSQEHTELCTTATPSQILPSRPELCTTATIPEKPSQILPSRPELSTTTIPEKPSELLPSQENTELCTDTFKDEDFIILNLTNEEIAEFRKDYL